MDFKSLRNDYQDEDDDEVDEELNKMSTDMLIRTDLASNQDNPDRPKTQKEIMMEV